MQVSFVDLNALYEQDRAAIDDAIQRVLASQRFIMGPEVSAFENEIAAFLVGPSGPPHTIGVSSGTDALILALRALDIGPGDEVIVPAYTFVATASTVALVGATPVFADVDARSLNLTPATILPALSARTRAVVPVHLFGHPCDVPGIRAAIDEEGRDDVKIIEDAAQAIGARHRGQPVCTMGDLACVSFFPAKNLGAFGDGGLVVTGDKDLAERVDMLRQHGSRVRYEHELLGTCARLDALQAAILRVRLASLPRWTRARRENAEHYRALFEERGLAPHVVVPAPPEEGEHVYNQFNVRAQRRDELRAHLRERGVPTAVYYPKILPDQPVFSSEYGRGNFAVSRAATRESLAIPIHPTLTAAERTWVADQIAAFYAEVA